MSSNNDPELKQQIQELSQMILAWCNSQPELRSVCVVFDWIDALNATNPLGVTLEVGRSDAADYSALRGRLNQLCRLLAQQQQEIIRHTNSLCHAQIELLRKVQLLQDEVADLERARLWEQEYAHEGREEEQAQASNEKTQARQKTGAQD